jgi:hypothetical protein
VFNPYVGSEILPIGENPFFIHGLPLQLPAFIHPESLMIVTQAKIDKENSDTVNYLIDNTGSQVLAWSANCEQSLEISKTIYPSCANGPTFVTESAAYSNTTNYTGSFSGLFQGGYTVDGWFASNKTLEVNSTNGTMAYALNNTVGIVTEIVNTTWIYNITN